MARYVCNTTCYWSGRVWRSGEQIVANDADIQSGRAQQPPKHFTKLDDGPVDAPATTTTAHATAPRANTTGERAFDDMSLDELHAVCDMLNISKNGNKATLIARLQSHQAN